RTPKAVQEMEQEMPELYTQLVDLRNKLEKHYNEVQDYEYTIEKGQLYCLQTRNGKMNATAMVRTSVEMFQEGMITKEQALLRINPESLDQMLHPRLDPTHSAKSLATGLAASPGAASGKCVFDADRAEIQGNAGEKVILVREETKPEDIHGFFTSQGILTSRGGKTSHAAVVGRSMGKPCVAGAKGIAVNIKTRQAIIGAQVLNEGDVITIDGTTGKVYLGALPTIKPEFTDELKTLLSWADEIAHLKVLANADTPTAAHKAVEYGAMGIGLCRTERMFNDVDRLPIVVDMILAEDLKERQAKLDELLPIQRGDFKEVFKVMSPRPVTVRLLDPPLHEFLPTEIHLFEDLETLRQLRSTIKGMEIFQFSRDIPANLHTQHANPFMSEDALNKVIAKKAKMLKKVRELYEVNPMLGHRGVRLGITNPEIYAMQIRAILEAAAECIKENITINPEIMIPQVITAQELKRVKKSVDRIQKDIETTQNVKLKFKFGTMIETVRACTRASQLSEVADFFSFGTNDLSQATFSFSREDAENKFLPEYNKLGIFQDNPFEVLDIQGVGFLMRKTVKWGRQTQAGLKMGICGEHGGHPAAIRFCHHIGLNYVSCSAPRVPCARLAAAQAKLLENDYHLLDE
ncbi:MAG: pyruvate, phosphate dikinase, partial [Thiomargarita sp.]|nr:pyruvate, phosphate dikinase [Thiomargarita sp.]